MNRQKLKLKNNNKCDQKIRKPRKTTKRYRMKEKERLKEKNKKLE